MKSKQDDELGGAARDQAEEDSEFTDNFELSDLAAYGLREMEDNTPLPDYDVPAVLPFTFPRYAIGRRKTSSAQVMMVPSVKQSPYSEAILKKILAHDSKYVSEDLKAYMIRTDFERNRAFLLEEKDENSSGNGIIMVNNKRGLDYFHIDYWLRKAIEPLVVCNAFDSVKVICKVQGGGVTGQSDAVKLGIARCLLAENHLLKKALKQHKFLTRDGRMVERKKPGQKKARKKFQWVKR